jgi:hypothetical protein
MEYEIELGSQGESDRRRKIYEASEAENIGWHRWNTGRVSSGLAA